MAVKAKPKSNRAKFTLGKKTEKAKTKPKAEVEKEAPKKEPKKEVEEKQVEAEAPQTAKIAEKPAEKEAEVNEPEAVVQEESPQPQVTESQTPSQQTQESELPQNPFSVAMPTMQEHEHAHENATVQSNENPFTAPTSANEEHAATSPIETPTQPVAGENSELSPTLPKEDTMPRQSTFDTPVEVETTKGKGIIIYFVIVAFIAFLVGIGSMALFTFGANRIKGGMPHLGLMHFMAKATPTPIKTTQAAAPTPTPTKPVDLTAYNINILNGSGITGAASKLKTELTTGGFKVGVTGNADKSSYTDTIVSAKKGINPDYLAKLKQVLSKDYSVGQDTQLSDSDAKTTDIIITIGSNPAK